MHRAQSKAGGVLGIQNMHQNRGPQEGWGLDSILKPGLSHKERAGLDDG